MNRLHPVVNFIYFAVVLGCSMMLMHPVCLAISFVAAFCYTIQMFGYRNARKGLCCMAGVMVVAAILNPAFSHQGVTTICYLPGGNALTLESICYGIAAAFMLGATLMWFRCISEILTADKIVYLFGKVFPVLSMILSMVLGFIPKMQRKLKEIRCTENAREKGWTQEDYPEKGWIRTRIHLIRRGIQNVSLLITWALQDSVDMADSMKGRGYGLPGRTAYTTFRFTKWDRMVLSGILVMFVYIVIGGLQGGLEWEYYPVTGGRGMNLYSVSLYVVYGLMCFLPVGIELRERLTYSQGRVRA